MVRKLIYVCAWISAVAVALTAEFLLMQGIPVSQPLSLGKVQAVGGQAYMTQLEPVSRCEGRASRFLIDIVIDARA